MKLRSGDLIFYKVQDNGEEATTGIYQCIASNLYGIARSNNASVLFASKQNHVERVGFVFV